MDTSETSIKANDEQILSSFFKTDMPLFQLTPARPNGCEFHGVSIHALQANAFFTSLSLEVVSSLCRILQSGILRFIPSILYPIVQKASDINHSLVQRAATSTLHQICSAVDCPSLTELFTLHFDLLMECVSRDLNMPSISNDSKNFSNIIVGINCLLKVIEQIISKLLRVPVRLSETDQKLPQNIQLLDVIESLLSWFDNNFEKSNQALNLFIEIPHGLLKVLIVSSRYLSILVNLDTESSTWDKAATTFKVHPTPWLDCLQEFVVDPIGHTDNVMIPQSFTSDATPTPIFFPSVNCSSFIKRIAKVTRKMMFLCSFFFSLDDVRVQRSTCEVLKYAMITLGRIEQYVKVCWRDDGHLVVLARAFISHTALILKKGSCDKRRSRL